MYSRHVLLWLALIVAVAGGVLAWGLYTSAMPGDERALARAGLVTAVTVVLTGTLVICGTARVWFRASRTKR